MKILNIVGARPNFMKVAPLHRSFVNSGMIESKIIHTGQHFDSKMSEIFFEHLELPTPEYFLGVGSGTHTEITARIMTAMEPIVQLEKPDLVLVVGDVTSTLASALVAVRNNIKLAHVEAGLRSYDRNMPEEVNRVLTDQISDFLFTTERNAKNNLLKENIDPAKIFFTGNCMIDSLIHYLPKAATIDIRKNLGIGDRDYLLMTMHRPSNVDTSDGINRIFNMINATSQLMQVVFPIHPRTKNKLAEFGLLSQLESNQSVIITEPLGYLEFIGLMNHSSLILTDSGGIQEESTYLKKPCITFRSSTERPITVEVGSNVLMSDLNVDKTIELIHQIRNQQFKQSEIPELWDGNAAHRIKDILIETYAK